jgi:basic amino acid/polyamine antiporter, APA family
VLELFENLFRIKSVESIIRMSQKPEHQLKKVLGPIDLVALGIGAIIGAGIFVITGTAAAGGASHLGAGPAIIISFIITGIACGFAALCYAEFASFIPIAGSAYTYSYATMGELVAWIIGWDLILEYMVASSAVAIGWSGYFKSLLEGFNIHLPNWITTDIMTVMEAVRHPEKYIEKFAPQYPDLAAQLQSVAHSSDGAARVDGMLRVLQGGPDLSSTPLLAKFHDILLTYQMAPHVGSLPFCINLPAFLVIIFITTLLVVGISESARVNSFIVALKLVILLIFICAGIPHIDPKNWVPFMPNGIAGIQTGAAMIFFAYIGFDAVSTTAEEARNPGKDLPIGIMGSLVICTVLYVIVSGIMTGMCPWNLLGTSEPVATALKYVKLDFLASYIISVGAVVALLAVLIVMQLGQPRIFFSMSRDGFVPKWLSAIHPKFRTPYRTTILSGTIVALGAAVFNINEVAELCNIGTLFAFVLVCAGVAILRHKDSIVSEKFKSKAIPWILILVTIISVFALSFSWHNAVLRIGFGALLAMTLIAALIVSLSYRGFIVRRPFSSPLVPLVPILGILTCVYLMLGLPPLTWWRFFVWLLIGLVIYIFYGRKHTSYDDEAPGSPAGDVPTEEAHGVKD